MFLPCFFPVSPLFLREKHSICPVSSLKFALFLRRNCYCFSGRNTWSFSGRNTSNLICFFQRNLDIFFRRNKCFSGKNMFYILMCFFGRNFSETEQKLFKKTVFLRKKQSRNYLIFLYKSTTLDKTRGGIFHFT